MSQVASTGRFVRKFARLYRCDAAPPYTVTTILSPMPPGFHELMTFANVFEPQHPRQFRPVVATCGTIDDRLKRRLRERKIRATCNDGPRECCEPSTTRYFEDRVQRELDRRRQETQPDTRRRPASDRQGSRIVVLPRMSVTASIPVGWEPRTRTVAPSTPTSTSSAPIRAQPLGLSGSVGAHRA